MRIPRMRFARFLALALCAALPAAAQKLDESVVTIPKKGMLFTAELETTVYKPAGEGPFPIAVINHGKAFGDPRFQARYRPEVAARYFVERGYLVLVPMRQGFSKSSGNYVGAGCNVESNGRVQAEDVQAALDYATALPYADKQNIVVVGQSHGGWTTLAFGTLNYPGVKALVNFAGGLKQETCVAWENVLARSAGHFGAETKTPSLWFYGDNDSYFKPETFRAMHEAYVSSGGKAKLVAYGTFGDDSHRLFGAKEGRAIWEPELTAFLGEAGLPARIAATK